MKNDVSAKFAILALVGPGDVEFARLHRMLQSVFLHDSGICEIVLIDDTRAPELGRASLPATPGVKITILPHEREGKSPAVLGGMCRGVLQGLRYLALSSSGWDGVLKLDTDALVIRPFSEKLKALLDREPTLGTAGVVDLNCDGSPREWQPFSDVTFHLAKIFRVKRFGLLKRRIVLWGRWNVLRKVVRRARSAGYRWGEHSQGGGYFVSGKLLQEMAKSGYLEHGALWHDVYMSEDVMMGLYAVACGFRNIPFSKTDEVFGCSFQGLPFPPEEIVRRGFSIIHSVKNDPGMSEEDLFSFFQKA